MVSYIKNILRELKWAVNILPHDIHIYTISRKESKSMEYHLIFDKYKKK